MAELAAEDLDRARSGSRKRGYFGLIHARPSSEMSARGHEQVDVRVEEHGAGPGVQHGEKTRGGGAEETGVAGELQDRRGGGLHEQAVDDGGVSASDRAQLLGQGEGEVVEGAVEEQPRALRLEPAPGLVRRGTSGSGGCCRRGRRRRLDRNGRTWRPGRRTRPCDRPRCPPGRGGAAAGAAGRTSAGTARRGGGRCPPLRATERSRPAQRSLVRSFSGSLSVARTSRVRWV